MRRFMLAAFVFTQLVASSAGAQLLDRASSSVRGGDDDQDTSSSWDDDADDDYDQSSDEGVVSSASSAARGGGGGSSSRSRGGPRARYVSGGDDGSGYGGYGGGGGGGGPAQQVVTGVVALEGGYVLAGAARVGASASVDLDIISLGTRYSLFVESGDRGAQFAALGRLGVALRVVDEEPFVLRVGVGARHFQDSQGGVFGADLELGFDLFVAHPVVFSFDGGVGFVGEALVVQVRASVGILIDIYEIYVGYDYEALFGEHVAVDLGGPMLGLRFWL